MEISTSFFIQWQNGHRNFHVGFDTKVKWPWKFPRRFLYNGKMAIETSTSVLIQRQKSHGNFHVAFDTKAKSPWKFQRHFLAEVHSEH